MGVDLANLVRGLLEPFGLVAGKGGGRPFVERVRNLVAASPPGEVAEALLAAWQAINDQVNTLSRRLIAIAREHQTVQRLMTAPGVGVVVALAYVNVIDDPARFARSSSIGTFVGLTPRRFQSGEEDYTRRILMCGDAMLRGYLFEVAGIILHRVAKWSVLEPRHAAAQADRRQKGDDRVARKLSVILHRMLRDGSTFRWSAKEIQAA
jgi:transposase